MFYHDLGKVLNIDLDQTVKKDLTEIDNYDTTDGTGVRDYVHVSDLAKAHIDSIEYIKNNNKNLTINLGIGKGYSVLDIIKKVEKITKKNIKYCILGRRVGDPDMLIAKAD